MDLFFPARKEWSTKTVCLYLRKWSNMSFNLTKSCLRKGVNLLYSPSEYWYSSCLKSSLVSLLLSTNLEENFLHSSMISNSSPTFPLLWRRSHWFWESNNHILLMNSTHKFNSETTYLCLEVKISYSELSICTILASLSPSVSASFLPSFLPSYFPFSLFFISPSSF
jgi:glucose-6-phosphate-specific signal transduction histidine kinase